MFKVAAGICRMSAQYQPAPQRFFSFPIGRGRLFDISIYEIKKADNRQGYFVCYRLCVCTSGSLITVIFMWCAVISVSCLHLGQYRGKFISTVSPRIFSRVLLWHIGHSTHWISCNVSPSYLLFLIILPCSVYCICDRKQNTYCYKPARKMWHSYSLLLIKN